MYLAHYRLEKEPFAVAAAPEFLWTGDLHARALETLRAAVLDGDGCVILTGDIGTGKTTLIKHVVDLPGVAAVFVTASGPELNGLEFLRVLAEEFQMNLRFDSREEFIAEFTRLLLQTLSSYRNVVIIIDEAQRLTRDALKALTILADLQLNGRKALKIVFVGQLEFNAALVPNGGGDVLPKVAARCCLEPLPEADTPRYIAHRLKVAGREQPLFSDDAVRDIHALSKGYPRLINIICDHALLYGYSANLQAIDGRVIKECSRDLSVALELEDSSDDAAAGPAADPPANASLEEKAAAIRWSWRSVLYMAAAVAVAGTVFYWITR